MGKNEIGTIQEEDLNVNQAIRTGYLVALETGKCRGERPLKHCLSRGLGQKKNISI